MYPEHELHLSQAFKAGPARFATPAGPARRRGGELFAARTALGVLARDERAALARWLAWALARNPQALARIERTDARLAARVAQQRGPADRRTSASVRGAVAVGLSRVCARMSRHAAAVTSSTTAAGADRAMLNLPECGAKPRISRHFPAGNLP